MDALSYSTCVSAAAGALVAYTSGVSVYRLFFGPLKDVPGPWYTKISNVWLSINELSLRQCRAIDDLFAKYGPVVRLGPNKVGFIDMSAAKNAYTRFPKDDYYLHLGMNGICTTFTTQDFTQHAHRRRAFAPHYTLDNITSLYQHEMQDFATTLLGGLQGIAGSRAVDCTSMFRHLLVDVIMLATLDQRPKSTEKWSTGVVDPVSVAINDWPKRGLLAKHVPKWLLSVLQRRGRPRVQQFLASNDILTDLANSGLSAARIALVEGKFDDPVNQTTIGSLLRYRGPNGQTFDDGNMIAELMSHIISGVDTTSTTLSYTIWALAQHPAALKTLQAELDEVMDDPQRIPDQQVLADLPYLSAVIKETTRLYGSVPSALPRVVPATGEPFIVQGYKIAPGTTVLTQAWSVHRQESVFQNAEEWFPDRWLDETAGMQDAWMPFGLGPRMCVGVNLAMTNMRIALAALVRNFDLQVPPQTTPESMYILEAFVTFPRSMSCDIVFVPRSH